ncbi:MAG TPA: hypothetical protein VM422_00030 [Amaricoccus sp.]|nr:hypothetical protein [Amaricoccus sp.]
MVIGKWLGRGATVEAAEAAWLAPAAQALDWLADGPPRAIWCIANAPDAPVAEVAGHLAPGDLLVFYNTCQHAAAFAGRGTPALCFFHATERPGLVHGLAPDGRPLADLASFPAPTRAIVLKPATRPQELPPVTVAGLATAELETEPLAALFGRSDPATIPSAGFASVLILRVVNLRRGLAGLPPHRIVLCGFSGRYDGGGYMGHDFQAEQAVYAGLPDVEFLGPAPARAESRLHHDLATVFHPGYNGHARPKAAMLFDVAKLAFAAGDVPTFAMLVRQSLAINPGMVQIRWLLHALELLRGRGEALPGLEALAADLGTVKARWSAGFDRDDLGGIRYPSEIDHPQAQYTVPKGDRSAVLLLNETSKMPFNRWHLGCDLVSRHLNARLAAHGIEVAGWANGIAGLNRILAHDPEARFAGVVLNGEGTLHDDADRAFELLAMARELKAMGKKTFLVNSVWQDMGPAMAGRLADFDLVAFRESASRDAAARARPDARVVPDLCWLADLPERAPAAPCAVLDCVTPTTTDALRAVAAAANAPFFVMDRFFDAFQRLLTAGADAATAPRILGPNDVRGAERWVGGRFHGTVLALGAGVPMLSLPSNTAKIEATLGDIGLSDKMLDAAALDRIAAPADLLGLFSGRRAFSGADWQKVAAYRALAAREIDASFAVIADAMA